MEFAPEFSFRTRQEALRRFRSEQFDLLVIGGGITGAAVARDAALRGLRVALVEREDFAYGTSSRSSKLIHGGLRYLQNLEFGLVFEALSERAMYLRTAPHAVRPLPFYFPVYQGDPNGRFKLDVGLWLYDLLAIFRAPGFHRSLSRDRLLSEIPTLRSEGLQGGFRYFDASMWDDLIVVETLQSAAQAGAAVASRMEALSPIWEGDWVTGFRVRDRLTDASGNASSSAEEFLIRAHRVVCCAGPWTDEIGHRFARTWRNRLSPSKGVHLIFDLERIPVPGALVMSHPEDGRISFVIPRPDFGAGVAIVGTTDGPTPADPDRAVIDPSDVQYLMDLLQRYFPSLGLKTSDILSAYVGVRPLVAPAHAASLQKVSREHHIERGPGGSIFVAGGKYTTNRTMGEQIVDFALEEWRSDVARGLPVAPVPDTEVAHTREPINPRVLGAVLEEARREAREARLEVPERLFERYGADALRIVRDLSDPAPSRRDPEGFPHLSGQLRHAIRSEAVLSLEDFYLRRIPLFASRADGGIPWAESLSRVWAEERGLPADTIQTEVSRLREELRRRSEWRTRLPLGDVLNA